MIASLVVTLSCWPIPPHTKISNVNKEPISLFEKSCGLTCSHAFMVGWVGGCRGEIMNGLIAAAIGTFAC